MYHLISDLARSPTSFDRLSYEFPVLITDRAADLGHAAGAVLCPLNEHGDFDGADDQAVLRTCGNLSDQLLQSFEDFSGAISMNGPCRQDVRCSRLSA